NKGKICQLCHKKRLPNLHILPLLAIFYQNITFSTTNCFSTKNDFTLPVLFKKALSWQILHQKQEHH
ncbi:MAG: hypothetical protein AAGK47_09460, partial [Bacteroidota bacterium]